MHRRIETRRPQRERMLEVRLCLVVAAQLKCPPGSPHRVRDAPVAVAGGERMTGELRERRVRGVAIPRLRHVQHPSVTSPPLRGEQLVEHGLAGQGVTEGKAQAARVDRILDEQARIAKPSQRRQGRVLLNLRDGREQLDIEVVTDHRRPTHKLAVCLVELGRACQQEPAHARRRVQRQLPPPGSVQIESPPLHGVAHDLLDHEGDSAAHPDDRRPSPLVGDDAEDVDEHLLDVDVPERHELDLFTEPLTPEIAPEVIQAGTGCRILRAVRHDQGQWLLPEGLGEVEHERVARWIRPMKVFQDEDEPLRSSQLRKVAGGGLEECRPACRRPVGAASELR